MSLSERNPYEVYAELMQRLVSLEVEVAHLKGELERVKADLEALPHG